ncbi:cobalt-precorrin-5B (C(1))-methyltransferase [Devosia rhodophyticola]|uniref:Cobalt-precorrin-5B C(1)-methyltransferase n=1 Tax=Devosia rhodophyticola TaxID=3026423 RepID=A0ABY7YZC6_9HYPH|nr:cobalt-precorrin-5B (C(1))-methyltransferase [Devosia rhodophyticola]WDR06589.1 cobalt-precorrin-5B (C(1))-methyltransferase [Devosia rhodophyticola]
MSETVDQHLPHAKSLRRGWTTGACATAATKSALTALLGSGFVDPVVITLPGGQQPAFALAHETAGEGFAEAGIIKDAGDDPDVTHGALVTVRVEQGPVGSGVQFRAGKGVGIVTKPGLPLAVGEPAINPAPRSMMTGVVDEVAAEFGVAADFAITISVRDGEQLAERTWNPRLGILGGLSILGTTGIVIPYSCAAWIHSIHRGIDVARAMGLNHVVGSTGDLSEKAAQAHLGLPIEAYLDMGDFAGGLLKYLKQHPVERLTIAGGFAKLVKLAQGSLDLHSARSSVELAGLAAMLAELGANAALLAKVPTANTANEVLGMANELGLANAVARAAKAKVEKTLGASGVAVSILVVDRAGAIVGEA